MHLIWWIIWVVFCYLIFVGPFKRSFKKSIKESPIDILKRRYANGDITKEEYEEKKKTLNISE